MREAEDWESAAGSFGALRLEDETQVFDTGVDDDHLALDLGYGWNESNTVRLRANRYRSGEFGFGFVDPALVDPNFNGTSTRIFYPFQDFDRGVLTWSGLAGDGENTTSFDLKLYQQSNERELVFDAGINIGPIFPGAPNSSVEIDTLNFSDVDTTGLRGEVRRGFLRRICLPLESIGSKTI